MEELQKRYIEFKILHQVIERTDNFFVVDGSINYLHARFNFCEDWQGVQPVAVFTAGEICKKIDVVNGECIVPWEVLQPGIRKFYVGCFAGSRITSNSARVDVNASCLGDPVDSLPPTPDVYDELLKASKEAVEVAQSVREDADSGKFDGASPVIETEGVEEGALFHITNANGSKEDVLIRNGIDGKTPVKGVDYNDGTSVTVARVSESAESGGINVVTFSDGKVLSIKNGTDGKTPVKGEDYYTDADKAEMVNDVLSALPTWDGGSY